MTDDSTVSPASPSDPVDDPSEADFNEVLETDAAIAEARQRIAQVPAEVVVTNHIMGLYELAAIHLSSEVPDLVAASLAIDAMGALVDNLGDRIGPDAPVMRDALANIRVVFVQRSSAAASAAAPAVDDESA